MLDFKFLLIIILLSLVIYLIYNLYSYQSNKFDNFKENINEKLDLEFEDLNDKLEEIQECFEKKLIDCNKKIKDLYSLQNKMNEINKMNNQSIINQINHYDEEIEDNNEQRDQIFNSIENSISDKKNNNCFIKLNQIKTNEKENFYMSPENNLTQNNCFENNNSKTSNLSQSSKVSKTSKTSKTSKSSKVSKVSKTSESSNKNLKEEYNDSSGKEEILSNESDSIVLEINNNFIKTSCIKEDNIKATNAYKSLNKFSKIIKNNLNNVQTSTQNTSEEFKDYIKNNSILYNNEYDNGSEKSNIEKISNDDYVNDYDPVLLHPEMINNINFFTSRINKNKIIEIND